MYVDILTEEGPGATGQEPEAQGPAPVAVLASCQAVRQGLRGLLRRLPEVGRVRECESPDQFARLLMEEVPRALIVAVADAGWLHPYRDRLADQDVGVFLLVEAASIAQLSCHSSLPVRGYLWQPSLEAEDLHTALRSHRRGQVPMPPELVRVLLERAEEGDRWPRGRPVRLTGRERETLQFLVQGMSNKQIAKRLSISSHGAKRLVASIMLKLDAPNRTLAAVTAIRTGLVEAT